MDDGIKRPCEFLEFFERFLDVPTARFLQRYLPIFEGNAAFCMKTILMIKKLFIEFARGG